MYDYLIQTDEHSVMTGRRGHDPALFHRRGYQHLLRVHRDDAARVAAGRASATELAPLLLKRIADARTLKCAFDSLVARGGEAPGPNGLVLMELEDSTAWSLCRALAHAIRNVSYRPGLERHVQISKGPNRGYRTLTIQNGEDRIVAKAVLLVLQPVIDPMFQWFSMGSRPHHSPLQALAAAVNLIRLEQRQVWISADVEKAFDQVPYPRLLAACRHHFRPDVMQLIRLVSDLGDALGIRQGSPLSPFLWNVFADLHIDQPFLAKAVPGRMLRYVDDVLVACRTRSEAEEAFPKLALIARSAGTSLKPDAAVADLAAGDPVTWLGYHVQRHQQRLAITIAPGAWDHLAENLHAAHLAPAAPLRAIAAIEGWLGALGPCFEFEERRKAISRVRELAETCGFTEIPTRLKLEARWEQAWARWQQVLKETTLVLPQRLGDPDQAAHHQPCAP